MAQLPRFSPYSARILLRRSAENLISKSTWLPCVSEIRAEARRIACPIELSAWDPHTLRSLREICNELEIEFFHHRIFDRAYWFSLASEFDRYGCSYSAQAPQDHVALFQHILDFEQSAEQKEQPVFSPVYD